jgi:hypothetical protein
LVVRKPEHPKVANPSILLLQDFCDYKPAPTE